MNREEKKRNKIERYNELAKKAQAAAEQACNNSINMISVIPAGQPILIGHHSERGHRRLLARSDNAMRKAVELGKKVEYYEDKATAAENNNAIYLDDNEAIGKLQEKIQLLEKYHDDVKKGNKIVKNEKLSELEKFELLTKMGFDKYIITSSLTPNFRGAVGFASYILTNNSANIRRLKKRLEQAKILKNTETSETVFNGVRVINNTEDNRLQLFFPDIPNEEIRKKLKSNGFRWSPLNGCWQSYLNRIQGERAKDILNEFKPE